MLFLYIENYVKKTIDKLAKKYCTNNMIEVVYSNKNLFIHQESLTEDVNGYYTYISPKRQILIINSDLSQYSRESALFHEYGHALLKHKGKLLTNSPSLAYTKKEYHADMVSAYMFLVHNHIDNDRINEIVLPDRIMHLIYKFLK